jgi:DNA mismatch repair protein MutS
MSKLIEQYINLYATHSAQYGPNTAILLLVGSFYELYDIPDPLTKEPQTSMKRAIDLMGIKLTTKLGNGPKGCDTLFGGFPEDQLHKFANLLTRENWTVVVLDQTKTARGKVESRDVVRILSPGTHSESSTADTLYVGGLWLEPASWTDAHVSTPPSFGAAVVDITTGATFTYEATTSGTRTLWSSDDLVHFFQVFCAREIIVWWAGDEIDMPEEAFVRRLIGVPSAHLHLRPAPRGGLTSAVAREDLLRRCFKPKSVLPLRTTLRISELPLTELALCAVLEFLLDHHAAAVALLRLPTIWSPEESVYLGNHALTQLNIITPKEDNSVLSLFLRTFTAMGRREMRRRILYPITDAVELEKRYTEIDWASGEGAEDLAPFLRSCADLTKVHRKLILAGVDAEDVLALDQTYHCVRSMAATVGPDTPLTYEAEKLEAFESWCTAFLAAFDIEKARSASSDLFCLTAVAGPRCAEIEAAIAAERAQMIVIHKELSQWSKIDLEYLRLEEKEAHVHVALNKSNGVHVSAALKKKGIPEILQGTEVNAKKSSQTVEIPALSRCYAQILSLRDQLVKTVREELGIVCDSLSKYAATWDSIEAWVSKVDMSMTIAAVSKKQGFVRPRLVEGTGSQLRIEGLRHPLIEIQKTRTQYVCHDVELGAAGAVDGWLVYGMNASGKSSLMKAVGIATILAQAGCFVPARRFEFTPFFSLFTRILNKDDLWAGLSSFAVEMSELVDILKRAGPHSLVLGDEVCSGTESSSAMSIVGASIAHLSRSGAKYIFATHLHGLQSVPEVAEVGSLRVWHLRVRHDPVKDLLIYDRTLHPGAGSSLYGLEVAKAMGLPLEVLEAAHGIRRRLTGQVNDIEAAASTWNTAVTRRACEVCGADIAADLEVHHIVERHTAVGGRLPDGTALNAPRNLIVVCEACHDKHHAGQIQIGPMVQTSEGPQREVTRLEQYAYRPQAAAGLTEEQLAIVKRELRAFPTLNVLRMIFDLRQRYGIVITAPRLRTIRSSL